MLPKPAGASSSGAGRVFVMEVILLVRGGGGCDAGKVSAADYHATLYNVSLYNDFDKNIARADLEKLLESIMTEFRTQFEKTYSYL